VAAAAFGYCLILSCCGCFIFFLGGGPASSAHHNIGVTMVYAQKDPKIFGVTMVHAQKDPKIQKENSFQQRFCYFTSKKSKDPKRNLTPMKILPKC
jgi:hypothetical protein